MIVLFSTLASDIKDVVSLTTPIVIAVAGYFINRSVQQGNAIEQRRSTLANQWAGDFALLVKRINDSATDFLFLHHKLKLLEEIGRQDWLEDYLPKADPERLELGVSLSRSEYVMARFLAFLPNNGDGLKRACRELMEIADSWLKNRGGKVEEFRAAQLNFNRLARSAHAELLESDERKTAS